MGRREKPPPKIYVKVPEPTSVVWEPEPLEVPSLVSLVLDKMAASPHELSVDALDAMDGALATALLKQIMLRQALNTSIALKFIQSRHADIADALSRLDLVAGVPPS